MRSIGSTISVEDLESYQARKVKALEAALPGVDGYKIMTVPPPAGGVALIDILNILKGKFDLKRLWVSWNSTNLYLILKFRMFYIDWRDQFSDTFNLISDKNIYWNTAEVKLRLQNTVGL